MLYEYTNLIQNYGWKEELRISFLTASNFGKLCKNEGDHAAANKVKKIMFPHPNLQYKSAIKYGKHNEEIARKRLEKVLKLKI
jgi:hypothetical protein